MKAMVLGAAVLAMAGTAQARTTQTCAAVTQADVESQFKLFNDAWATGSPDRVTSLFGKDAVLLATVSNKPRTNHAEIRDYFVGFLKAKPVGTIDSSTVKLGCNKATRVGTWTVRLTDPATGQANDVKARFSFIYRLENGRWMIDHLHSSAMPEKVATAS